MDKEFPWHDELYYNTNHGYNSYEPKQPIELSDTQHAENIKRKENLFKTLVANRSKALKEIDEAIFDYIRAECIVQLALNNVSLDAEDLYSVLIEFTKDIDAERERFNSIIKRALDTLYIKGIYDRVADESFVEFARRCPGAPYKSVDEFNPTQILSIATRKDNE